MLVRAETLNPHLNAFVLIDADGARAAAQASEARWQAGTPLSALTMEGGIAELALFEEPAGAVRPRTVATAAGSLPG